MEGVTIDPTQATPLLGAGRRLRLELKHFLKTIDGIEVLQSGRVFCLQGKLYQGFNGTSCAMTDETQLEDHEMDTVVDVDGTFGQVRSDRHRRNEGRLYAREKEVRDNQLKKDQAKLVGEQLTNVELEKEERRLRVENLRLENEILRKRAAGAELPEDPIGDPEPDHVCSDCGASFDNAKQLHGHRMGAHRK